jgi:phage repressor protein C with HTH and peptisase S24 domain
MVKLFMTPSSNEILDRIIILKKLKNDAGLARFLKVKPAIISNWRARGTIPYDAVFSLCEYDGLTLDYVISGRGPIYRSDEPPQGLGRRLPSEQGATGVEEKARAYTPGNDEFVYISQVIGRISAGRGRVPENAVDVRIAFRKEWIKRKGRPENMVLIKVDGDSMEPSLVSGDLVLIDRNRNYIDPQGGIYALALDDIIMIKRVQVLSERIRIISDNPKYEAFDVPVERIKVNGKVIWFARELER